MWDNRCAWYNDPMVIWDNGRAYTLKFDPEMFRSERLRRGFTLNDRRWWMKTPANSVARWQQGKVSPSDATILRILRTLRCKPTDICRLDSLASQRVEGATDGFDRHTFDHTVWGDMLEEIPISSATIWPSRD